MQLKKSICIQCEEYDGQAIKAIYEVLMAECLHFVYNFLYSLFFCQLFKNLVII